MLETPKSGYHFPACPLKDAPSKLDSSLILMAPKASWWQVVMRTTHPWTFSTWTPWPGSPDRICLLSFKLGCLCLIRIACWLWGAIVRTHNIWIPFIIIIRFLIGGSWLKGCCIGGNGLPRFWCLIIMLFVVEFQTKQRE